MQPPVTSRILPCPECGGRGCAECATQFLDQLKLISMRNEIQNSTTAELRAEAIRIINVFAKRDGAEFDDTHPSTQTAIHLVMDVLLYLRNKDIEDGQQVMQEDQPNRFDLLEYYGTRPRLPMASEIDSPPWKKGKPNA